MRGNFVDIPTDCPQRDERVGWTGDIQVFAPTASFLYDASGMLSGWLRDVAAEQLPDGTIPWYVPVIPAHSMWTPIRPGAAWGDVATLTPWTLYERFGDAGVLEAQFDSARRWVDLDRVAGGPRSTVEHRLPARRLARPGGAAAGPRRRPHRPISRRDGVLREVGANRRADGGGARPHRRRGALPRARRRDRRRLRGGVRAAGRTHDQRRADRLRAGDRVRPDSGCRRAATPPATGSPSSCARRGNRIATGLRRHPARLGRADPDRAPRQGLRSAARAGLPLVAVPGRHGRDHGLGALGQPAARRQRQPGHDDLVQPLRARRRRRLAAPRRRRPRTGRAGLPRGAVRSAAGRRPHLRIGPAPDALRRGRDLVAHRGRPARRGRPRAGGRDGHPGAAGPACRDPRARRRITARQR